MKIFFISDIHGSSYYLKKAMEAYKNEGASYLVILGDILYHGARNPLPQGHNPKEVIEILNKEAQNIIALRGNCDSEVDQMVLDFPIMADYSNLILNHRRLFLSHGHIYNQANMPKLNQGSAFIYGHTHLPRAEKKDGIYFLNPGSLGLPKENNPHSYGVLEGNHFRIMDLESRLIEEIKMD